MLIPAIMMLFMATMQCLCTENPSSVWGISTEKGFAISVQLTPAQSKQDTLQACDTV